MAGGEGSDDAVRGAVRVEDDDDADVGREADTARAGEARAPGWARLVATLAVRGRLVVLSLWIAAAVAATLLLPTLGAGGAAAEGLIDERADAITTQVDEARAFGSTLLADTVVVQRQPDGLSADAQRRLVERAARVTDAGAAGIAAAVPVIGMPGLVPAREQATTAITYLFFRPSASIGDRDAAARGYLSTIPAAEGPVGVTGVVPARVAQERAILDALDPITIATVVLILLVLGLALRSPFAPLVALAAAGVAYLVAVRLVAWLGEETGFAVPREVEPLMLVLVLGIVTDYAIFYLVETRRRVRLGEQPRDAARNAAGHVAPVVLTAGLIVAGGCATVTLGTLAFFRALGPGLAVSALVAMVVALTLVPALIGLAGARLFRRDVPEGAPLPPVHGRLGRLRARVQASRVMAIPVAALAIAGLVVAAEELRHAQIGFSLTKGLERGTPERDAADAAGRGIAPGAISPTLVLLERPGQGGLDAAALAGVEKGLAEVPGVAGVFGPQTAPDWVEGGLVLTADRSTARLIVILDDDPFSGAAIDTIERIRAVLPDVLAAAGAPGASARLGGQTALADETVQASNDNIWRLALAALAVNFVLLVAFLRAVVAPLYLLVASVLGVGAALGATAIVSDLLGWGDIGYYVPFAAAVLLLSLGSDYNVFLVGRIWAAARHRPLNDAVAVAAPQAAVPVSLAGVVLAGSFALLGVVPVIPLRQLALALALGVLIDTFLVRSILVPALVTAFGALGGWPGRLWRRERGEAGA